MATIADAKIPTTIAALMRSTVKIEVTVRTSRRSCASAPSALSWDATCVRGTRVRKRRISRLWRAVKACVTSKRHLRTEMKRSSSCDRPTPISGYRAETGICSQRSFASRSSARSTSTGRFYRNFAEARASSGRSTKASEKQGLPSIAWTRGSTQARFSIGSASPIAFKDSLRETVEHNAAEISRRIPEALVHVITHFDELVAKQVPQGTGRNYTTPTFRQYRRMVRQHERLSSGL